MLFALMLLLTIEEFYPHYREAFFNGKDIKGMDVYPIGNPNKIGIVKDALVDLRGRFLYLVIKVSMGKRGKQVLVPFASFLIDGNYQRVYVDSITTINLNCLPEFTHTNQVDYEYLYKVNKVYQPLIFQGEIASYGELN